MLNNNEEERLVANAWEKGIRRKDRSARPFERIVGRFLASRDHRGTVVADMGPGHFDFGRALSTRGASVVGLELDPAVIALGKHRGLEVIEFDLRSRLLAADLGSSRWDGVFCNGSINCWWRRGLNAQESYVADLVASLKPGGWAYIAPCNYAPEQNAQQAARNPEAVDALNAQRRAFESAGFTVWKFNRFQRWRYAMSTDMRPAYVYTLNLRVTAGPW